MYHVTFPAQSNRASWRFTGQVTDFEDQPYDLTGKPMVFQISDQDGYRKLVASTDNGKITIVGLGTFQWFFTVQEMQGLCPGTYLTGLTLTTADGTETEQLSVGPLPITDGVVPQT